MEKDSPPLISGLHIHVCTNSYISTSMHTYTVSLKEEIRVYSMFSAFLVGIKKTFPQNMHSELYFPRSILCFVFSFYIYFLLHLFICMFMCICAYIHSNKLVEVREQLEEVSFFYYVWPKNQSQVIRLTCQTVLLAHLFAFKLPSDRPDYLGL